MIFNWQNNLDKEIKSERTHETKDFPHPTNPKQRIKIQSAGLLHAYTDKGFEDIEKELPSYKFPEGKEITKKASRHFMMDLPDWGDARVEENGKIVRVYDKKGKSIFRYKTPIVIEKGKSPFNVIEYEKVIKNSEVDEAEFEVIDKKLYFKLPNTLKNTYPLQAYDDTDTASTNNKDSNLQKGSPDTNFGSNTLVRIGLSGTDPKRGVMDWTMSAGSGTVTDVKLNLFFEFVQGFDALLDVHELTQTFVEAETTWNIHSTGNNWASAGGDFSATVIDSFQTGTTDGVTRIFILMGTGSTNPLTLDFEDNFDLMIKRNDEASGGADAIFDSKEHATAGQRPFLEITFTPAAGPANLKTLNTVATANIKTINGVVIASVKTINTVA